MYRILASSIARAAGFREMLSASRTRAWSCLPLPDVDPKAERHHELDNLGKVLVHRDPHLDAGSNVGLRNSKDTVPVGALSSDGVACTAEAAAGVARRAMQLEALGK